MVDSTIVNVALPTLSRELGAGTRELQWIVDASPLVFASLLLAFGNLGDRYGRKGALQAAMGVGAALVFPATLAILTNVFTNPTERAKAIGVWSAVPGLAVALLLGRRLVPTSRDSHAGRLDVVGLVTSTVGVVLLVYTVIEAPRAGWTSPRTIIGLAVAGVLAAGFVRWELHRRDPCWTSGSSAPHGSAQRVPRLAQRSSRCSASSS